MLHFRLVLAPFFLQLVFNPRQLLMELLLHSLSVKHQRAVNELVVENLNVGLNLLEIFFGRVVGLVCEQLGLVSKQLLHGQRENVGAVLAGLLLKHLVRNRENQGPVQMVPRKLEVLF